MFINEVEHKVGLSKKSIRYYEEYGLLSPKRGKENDYRIYSDDDVKKLKIIKFLRELGISIKELQMLSNKSLTLKECMIDHLKKIDMETEKFMKIKNMCHELSQSKESFEELNIPKYFEEMNILNKEGFTMRNVKTTKTRKIIGAIIPSIIFGMLFLLIPSIITYFQITESGRIPWPIFWGILIFFSFPIAGIIYNLVTRIIEINKGEEDEASKY